MFSYRHGFHAGNHADVLKHITLLACLRLLHKKETPLMLIDTHAGAGVYDLEDRFSLTSKEAEEGVLKLFKHHPKSTTLPLDLQNYLQSIQNLQTHPSDISLYPGSPYLLWTSLRSKDKLRLTELHPSDYPILQHNFTSLKQKGQDIQMQMSDGFAQLKAFLPPPSRRGLILIDPSYENKADYMATLKALTEAFKRFSTGVYLIWYPILSRLEAKDFAMRLSNLAQGHHLPWLQAELRIKDMHEVGLSASGMFVINPPWQLQESLQEILPLLQESLALDQQANHHLETSPAITKQPTE
jgi:23S rRNA (adenine2030-N6)-methyltransferase